MWKIRLLVISFVLLLLISCQSSETLTPTPFPPTPDNMPLGVSSSLITPVPAILSDVMANPEFYEGAHILVTGQYFRKPLQVCGIDPHPSPAGWELVTGETLVPAGGFDEQLRQLMPDGITMTVIGRFSQWQGPVGCGKQAVPTEMWYLDVVKLVDPAQLARITLTPGSASDNLISDGIVADDQFTPVAESEESPPEEDVLLPTSPPVAPPTNTVQPTRVVPIETLGAGFTPVATDEIGVTTPTPSRPVVSTVEGTAVPNSTEQSVTPGVSTVTNTPPPGTTSTPLTSISTATTVPGSVKNMGDAFLDQDLDEVDFEVTDLGEDEIHEWTLPLDEGDIAVFSVIGEPDMDLSIKIIDEDLNVISQDENSEGEAESISFTIPQTSDSYKIQVFEINGKEGGYLLTYSDEEFLFAPQGMLTYGEGRSGTISSFEDHYWFLSGEEDDVIDLSISCEVEADLSVTLYDSDGIGIANLFFEEDMQDVLLSETGWYVFAIGLWDDVDDCKYTILVTKQ